MVGKHQNLLSLFSIYVGAVIGAGFATGQEVNQFFAYFGPSGLAGVALAGGVLIIGGRMLLNLAYQYQLSDYGQSVALLIGPGSTKALDILISFFLLASLAVMISGGGELLSTLLKLSRALASLLFSAVVVVGISRGIVGLAKINIILMPLLIVVSLALVIDRFFLTVPTLTLSLSRVRLVLLPNWWVAAILYSSLNLGIVFTVFSSLGSTIPDRATATRTGTWAGLTLSLLLAIFCGGILHTPGADQVAIPLAYLAAQGSTATYLAYISLLFMAMLTSAIATAFALVNRLRANNCGAWVEGGTMVLAWLVAQGGFAELVGTVYPVYGYFWGVMLIIILVRRILQVV